MATKYQNPPVIYTTAKLIYAESIGSYGIEKYEQLLSALKSLQFESYTISNLMGVQLNQADNQFTAIPTQAKRIGYFSSNRRRCAVIDERTIELRLTEYDNHSRFLDDFKSLIETCNHHGIAKGNKLKEIELHYVDLFVPTSGSQLKDMFSKSVTLPITQFYSDNDDAIKVGATNFTRVLASGQQKVSISLEQLSVPNEHMRKYLPDPLIEPDQNLAMPLDIARLFPSPDQNEYAIVHTACGSLVNDEQFEIEALRTAFEHMYKESRKTFDHMTSPTYCDNVWKVVRN